MAFMKFLLGGVLGGVIGYGLFRVVPPNEADFVKYLPPHSSEQVGLLTRYSKGPTTKYMNETESNVNSKEYKSQDSKVIEK